MARLASPLLLLAALCASDARALDDLQVARSIPQALAQREQGLPREATERARLETLQDVYTSRDFKPLWVAGGELTGEALALRRQLSAAEEYGLRPQDYLEALGALPPPAAGEDAAVDAHSAAVVDVALSTAALRFLTHVHSGRVDPHAAGFDLEIPRPAVDYGALLVRLANAPDLGSVIGSIEPQFYHYRLLKQSLSRYRLLAAGKAQPGKAELATAPYERRIRQIELTLERWRWLPAFDTPPIIVNIPQFRLFAFESTQDRKADILQMDVIVGRIYPRYQTPVFTADMKYVIFRPYWDVPYSITQREMLPAMRSKPGYLNSEHLQIVSGPGDDSPLVAASPAAIEQLAAGKLRLRQQPGDDNALGLIKFMFPNHYNVYLHSTPARRLFGQSKRAFSHGCIRVSNPTALAAYVLRNAPGSWTQADIDAAMHGPDNRRVNLTKPIRVLVLYGTALATEDGGILFFDDIYGHDRKLEALLGLPPVISAVASH